MNQKEREQQLKEWNERNKHVLDIHHDARAIVDSRIKSGYPKADLLLLTDLMMDVIKRFD